MATTISKQFGFEMAHRLTSPKAGKCGAIHGHSYRVIVTVSGEVSSETGMVMNFEELNFIKELLDGRYDHTLLLNTDDPIAKVLTRGDIPACIRIGFINGEPTAENIARELFGWILSGLPVGARLEEVEVLETSKCRARYRG